MRWWKTPVAAVVWTVVRIWLGLQWIEAGWGKLTGGFDAGGFLKGAIANSTGEHPAVQSWYASFLEKFALPNVHLFNVLVPYGEFLIGLGLILGLATIPALLAGAFMNLNFMLAGTTSTNPILYTLAIILLFVGTSAYMFGLDRFAVPFTKSYFNKGNNNQGRHSNDVNRH